MKELQSVLISVAILVIPVLGTFLVNLIKQKTKEVKTRVNNDKLNTYLYLGSEAIQQAVTVVNQTYVEALKKDGKFDGAAQKSAFDMSKQLVLQIMNDASKKAITQAYGDLNAYIETAIERYVNVNKIYVPAPTINKT